MSTKIVILAAGKGTRMKSARPKVLHQLGGQALLCHVINNVSGLAPESIYVVVGHGSEQVIQEVGEAVTFVTQEVQKGTGHAVQQVLDYLNDEDKVIIAYGDVPLTRSQTFDRLSKLCSKNRIGLLSVDMDNPTGYGRIVRDEACKVIAIVEEKDANEAQREIKEVNTGMLSIHGGALKKLLSRIGNHNAQGEYYLTDIFSLAVNDGMHIETVNPEDDWEVAGVNSRQQLARLERIYQLTLAGRLMSDGVSLMDPARIDIRGELTAGTDVEIDVNCVFQGRVELGRGVVIGPNCTISNTRVGDDAEIKANSVIEDADIGSASSIGPFARIRPGSTLKSNTHIGNFVEIKNSTIDEGSKVNHLSYVGDSDIGKASNIGAGTITCNYDGAQKHRTVLGNDVFIGSNTALVAPVEVEDGATIGAGSVITRNVSKKQLVVTRATQKAVDGWTRPKKSKK